ncbi:MULTISPECIES: hypothetical protein [Fischerella]|uniref:hypothetical protein n=1 Tax=Fischerella TaxID=1190 RepID=UPI00138AC922|nr:MULTISPECIES: hypothetical protein [Fischerella]
MGNSPAPTPPREWGLGAVGRWGGGEMGRWGGFLIQFPHHLISRTSRQKLSYLFKQFWHSQ